jgi:gentisate 1,2-dioxygenase
MSTTAGPGENAADPRLEALFAAGERASVKPLWPIFADVNPRFPKPKAVPHLWPMRTMRPLLHDAAELVPMERAERRVWVLSNPALRPPYTTDTLYGGLQIIKPGEVARCHRHTAAALRFIVEGADAYTAVAGEKIVMRTGDLVVTPSWDLHDHGNESNAPMIWLDGLDLPVFEALPTMFTEFYHLPRHDAALPAERSDLHFPWAEMRARLDAAPGLHALLRYRRRGGGEIGAIMGAAAERIAAGASTPPVRETVSAVVHVVAGTGSSRVGDTEFRWEPGDTFAVPSWHALEHRADAGASAYLFRYDDRPMIEALGLYRAAGVGHVGTDVRKDSPVRAERGRS